MAGHNDHDSLFVHPYPTGTGRQRSWTVQARASLLQGVLACASGYPARSAWLCMLWEYSTAWQDRASSQTDASPVVKVGFLLCWVEMLGQLHSLFLDLGKTDARESWHMIQGEPFSPWPRAPSIWAPEIAVLLID